MSKKVIGYIIAVGGGDYYTGGRNYVFQGEPYACIGSKSEAKIFKTLPLAKRTARALLENTSNVDKCYFLAKYEDGTFTLAEVKEMKDNA